jgi:hypothetical protein
VGVIAAFEQAVTIERRKIKERTVLNKDDFMILFLDRFLKLFEGGHPTDGVDEISE